MLRRLLLMAMVSFQCGASFADEAPPTLCSATQTPVFSCGVGTKTVSLCASTGHLAKDDLVLEYKFGVVGKPPELTYPADGRLAAKAFTFTTIEGGTTSVVAFDNKPASYDVMSAFDGNTLPKYGFTGIGVTLNEEQTRLRSCNPGALVANMKLLGGQGFFTSPLPPQRDNDKPPFRMVTKTIQHGPKWTSKIMYPVTGDDDLDRHLEGFATDCYDDDFGDEGECTTAVSAELVLEKYLALEFSTFVYETGAAHGDGEARHSVYVRKEGKWIAVADKSLIATQCKRRYASLLNRRIRPELTIEFADKVVPGLDDIFDQAEQMLTRDGVLFNFPPYIFGPRISPEGLLVDFKSLGKCFAPES